MLINIYVYKFKTTFINHISVYPFNDDNGQDSRQAAWFNTEIKYLKSLSAQIKEEMNPEVGNVKRKIVKEQGGNKWLNLPLHLSSSVSCVCATVPLNKAAKCYHLLLTMHIVTQRKKYWRIKWYLKLLFLLFPLYFFSWAQAINFNCRPLTTPIPHKTKKSKFPSSSSSGALLFLHFLPKWFSFSHRYTDI